jgi:hypothetical protein
MANSCGVRRLCQSTWDQSVFSSSASDGPAAAASAGLEVEALAWVASFCAYFHPETAPPPGAPTATMKRIDLAMGYSGAGGEWHADFRGLDGFAQI